MIILNMNHVNAAHNEQEKKDSFYPWNFLT